MGQRETQRTAFAATGQATAAGGRYPRDGARGSRKHDVQLGGMTNVVA